MDGTELELNPTLKTSADLEIFESITVTPPIQVLAWDPITQPRHEIKYKAAGGVSSHHFSSSNTSFAAVSQAGLAKTVGQGWCNISANIPKYPHLRGDAAVRIGCKICRTVPINYILFAALCSSSLQYEHFESHSRN